jgi:hypothetical protein
LWLGREIREVNNDAITNLQLNSGSGMAALNVWGVVATAPPMSTMTPTATRNVFEDAGVRG